MVPIHNVQSAELDTTFTTTKQFVTKHVHLISMLLFSMIRPNATLVVLFLLITAEVASTHLLLARSVLQITMYGCITINALVYVRMAMRVTTPIFNVSYVCWELTVSKTNAIRGVPSTTQPTITFEHVFYLGVTHFKCQLKSKDLKC
jgi:hypothetical protein